MRPRGVHVEVTGDPRAVGERLGLLRGAATAGERAVELVQLAPELGDALAFGSPPPFGRDVAAELRALGEAGDCGRGQRRLLLDAGRGCDRGAGGARLHSDTAKTAQRGNEDRGLVQDRRPRLSRPRGPDADPAAKPGRNRGTAGQRLRPQQRQLPARELFHDREQRLRQEPFAGPPLADDHVALLDRVKALGVDPERCQPIVAGEAERGRGCRLRRDREQRVDAREEAAPLRLSRRVAQPLGREEARDRQRAAVPKGDVRQARKPRLEAMDDVVAAARERQREVGPDAHREPDPAAPRDRHRRAERDHFAVRPVLERAAARDQVGRPPRWRQDRDVVAEASELGRRARDVLVHVVRLGPGEGRDQADPEAHAVESSRGCSSLPPAPRLDKST